MGRLNRLERRRFLRLSGASVTLAGVGLSACHQAPRIYDMQVSRDVGCSCCHVWTELVERTGRFRITLADAPDLPALKRKLRVPAPLESCHTAVVERYVVEGHVPAKDVLRLLDERPAGVLGIAVPGMPRGSPGMEQPNGAVDDYKVIAFSSGGGQSIFSEHSSNR